KLAILLPLPLFFAFMNVATPESAPKSANGAAKIGAFGLDLTAQDPKVKPGDDFFHYANGHWLATAQIPADRTRWGAFDELALEAEQRVRGILNELSKTAAAGGIEQKVGDYYRAFLDTDAIEKAGLTPAQPGLKAIATARTHEDLARLMGRQDLGLESPVGI